MDHRRTPIKPARLSVVSSLVRPLTVKCAEASCTCVASGWLTLSDEERLRIPHEIGYDLWRSSPRYRRSASRNIILEAPITEHFQSLLVARQTAQLNYAHVGNFGG